mgnify:CR=1 FL=1
MRIIDGLPYLEDSDVPEEENITEITVDKDFNHKCEICKLHPAKYDAATDDGSWAYMCGICFHQVCIGLGTGKGQKIIKK